MNKPSQELVNKFLAKGYLLSPDLETVDQAFLHSVETKIISKDKPVVLCSDIHKGVLQRGISGINWIEFDKSKVLSEKKKNVKSYRMFQSLLFQEEESIEAPVEEESALSTETEPLVQTEERVEVKEEVVEEKVETPAETKTVEAPSETASAEVVQTVEEIVETKEDTKSKQMEIAVENARQKLVQVVKSYDKKPKQWEVKDFIAYFRQRYDLLQNILQGRQELDNLLSLNRIKQKKEKEKVACIGLVYDLRTSKKGNIILSLEDPTGILTVILKPTVEGVDDLCLDEVVAITGSTSEGLVFGEQIIFPDIPVPIKPKHAPDEAYAAVISDIHVGSQNFLEKEFQDFIDWLNLSDPNHKGYAVAQKVKYLFVVGDLVAGTGVYPHQEQDLVIKDLRSQYVRLAEFLSQIRKDVQVIICPGNHDATRLAEPQPPLIREFAGPLFEIPNVLFVSSPSIVNIHKTEDFEGFNVLMYHGSSFHFYTNSISHLRLADAKNNPRLTWKYLLKKRHLAPTHGATVYIPDSTEDGLLIDTLPDIVLNGDIHRSDLDVYKGVMIICSSCWERKSVIQERRGNEPDPGRVPFLNLKTREVVFLDFFEEEKK